MSCLAMNVGFQVKADDTTCTEAFETEIKNDMVINQDVRTMLKRKYVLAKRVYTEEKSTQPLPNKITSRSQTLPLRNAHHAHAR